MRRSFQRARRRFRNRNRHRNVRTIGNAYEMVDRNRPARQFHGRSRVRLRRIGAGRVLRRIPFRKLGKAGAIGAVVVGAWEGHKIAGSNKRKLGHIWDGGFKQIRKDWFGPIDKKVKPNPPKQMPAIPPTFATSSGINLDDNVSYSRCKLPTMRRSKKGHSDKLNCSHGNMADHDAGQASSLVGKALLKDVTAVSNAQPTGAAYSSLKAYSDCFYQRLGTTVSTTDGALANINRKFIEVVWQKQTSTYVNINTHQCTLEIYDLVLKKDIDNSVDAYSPRLLMDVSASTEGNYTGGSSKDIDGADDLSFNPLFAKDLWAYYKLHRYHKVVLKPGESHVHTVFHRMNYILDYTMLARNGIVAEAGYASRTFIRATGKVVHTVPAGLVTIDGVKLDLMWQCNTYIREFQPLFDWFYLDMAKIDYSGVGAARNTVASMELEDHTEETGIV